MDRQNFSQPSGSSVPVQEEPLAERTEAAVDLLEGLPARRRVTVVADADVDGTAAAALLAVALQRRGRRFVVVLTRSRDEGLTHTLEKRAPEFLITADLGASHVPTLQKMRIPSVVLDHHEPAGDGDGAGLVHVNPHLVGEDGSSGASGAAVAFRFAEALLKRHDLPSDDLLPMALLGAWGDRYHGADPRSGLHGRLVAQALNGQDEPPIPWHSWAPDASPGMSLAEALAHNLDPLVPRLKGEAQQAQTLLQGMDIDPKQNVETLSEPDRAHIASWLAAALLEQGASAAILASMLSPRPVFPPHTGPIAGSSVAEVALRVDAATRRGAETTALAALLGHEAAWQQINGQLEEYRHAVFTPVVRTGEGSTRFGPGHLVRVEAGWMAGPVADRLMAWSPLGAQPVVVLGATPGGVKVSLRARPGTPWRLDRVAQQAGRTAGGAGGGHRLAAGALVPREKESALLEKLAELLDQEAVKEAPA